MNFINYLLVSLVAFLGIFVGFFLALYTKEELKQGKKYFILLQKILLTLIFGFLLFFFQIQLNIILFISIIFLVFLLVTDSNQQLPIYIALGIIFSITSCNHDIFLTVSSLIFLYGIPTGTLLTQKMLREKKITIIKNLLRTTMWFLVIAIILYDIVTTYFC